MPPGELKLEILYSTNQIYQKRMLGGTTRADQPADPMIERGIDAFNTPANGRAFYISLAGNQRMTNMTIHRTQKGGGIFQAPLKVNAAPDLHPGEAREEQGFSKLQMTGTVNFPGNPIPWSFPVAALDKRRIEPVFVDTDGDLRPDTLPSVSNFVPVIPPNRVVSESCACIEGCHMNEGEMHCYYQIPPHCYSCTLS